MSKANALTITNLNYNSDVKTYCNILFHFFFFQLLISTVSVEGEELGFLLGLDIFNTLISVLSSGIGFVRPIDKLFQEEM